MQESRQLLESFRRGDGTTIIRIFVPRGSPDHQAARLAIYDLQGKYKKALSAGPLSCGSHEITMNGKGVYVARLTMEGRSVQCRAVIY
jgi:hypothetical protein